jgi:hypothetical protein
VNAATMMALAKRICLMFASFGAFDNTQSGEQLTDLVSRQSFD